MYTVRTSWIGDFPRGITRDRGHFPTIDEARTAGRSLVLSDMLASPTMDEAKAAVDPALPTHEFAEAVADQYWDLEKTDRNAAPYLSVFEIDHQQTDAAPAWNEQTWFASPEDLIAAFLCESHTADALQSTGRPITVYRRLVDAPFPGPVMRYFYLTEQYQQPWIAEIDADVLESGTEFIWDDEPAGYRADQSAVSQFLADATPVGYIGADHQLHITARWEAPTGWGLDPRTGTLAVTSTTWVGR